MSSRQGANSRPHISDLELLSKDVSKATRATFKAADEAQERLDALSKGIEALSKNPKAQRSLNKEFVFEALDALAEIRDAASGDIRALAMWATGGDGQELGITETRIAGIIGASNSTVNRWNRAGVVTWEESDADQQRALEKKYGQDT